MKRATSERGFSLVELLVGIVTGLLVVAAATALLLAQLREARRLVLDAHLAQDLRSATELVGSELRRSGHWAQAEDGVRRAGAGPVPGNPLWVDFPAAAAASASATATDAVAYRYDSVGQAGNGRSGFRLRDAAIEMQLDAGAWQALTDNTVLAVTHLGITPAWRDVSLAAFCAAPCPADAGACPPRARALSYAIDIRGHLVADPRAQRIAHADVRVRNGTVIGRCAE